MSVDEKNKKLKDAGVPHPPANASDIGLMCSENIHTWYPKQNEAKPYRKSKVGEFEWSRIDTVMKNVKDIGDVTISEGDKKIIKQWYTDRLSDQYLTDRMNELHWKVDLGPKKRLKEFRKEISANRGSTVTCVEPTQLPDDLISDDLTSDALYQYSEISDNGCISTHFGPDYIISKEYEEWSSDYITNPKNLYESGKGDFKVWGKPLMPINRKFEKCINTVLDENTNEFDLRMIKQIHQKGKKHKSIFALNDNEISFIERKLQMLISDSSTDEVLDCIRDNTMLDKSICNAGLSEQMNFVLNILFSIIGYQFNLDELNVKNTDNKKKMIKIIDKLGDLIPRALKKIIDISKKLEIEKGCISQNTEVLEELYSKIFTSGKNVVNFDLGISKMISDASPKEFDRTTILAVLAIAFLKYF